MAQLRYSKAIACGTAITVGLVGAYLYKKRSNRRILRKSLGEEPCKLREFEKENKHDLKSSCDAEEDRLSPHHQCRETCTAGCECGNMEPDGEDTPVVTVNTESNESSSVEKPVAEKDSDKINENLDMDRAELIRLAAEGLEEMVIASEQAALETSKPVVEETIVSQSVSETRSAAPVSSETEGDTQSDEVFTNVATDSSIPASLSEPVEHLDWASAVAEEEKTDKTAAETAANSNSTDASKANTNVNTNSNTSNGQLESSMAGSDGGSEVNSEGSSSDSGRGSIDTSLVGKEQTSSPELPPTPVLYQFEFPTELCGRLIGKQGRNIKELRDKTGAKIFLKPSPVSTKYQLCIIDGLPKSIEQTIDIIKRRFPDVDTNRQSLTADSQGQNVKMPSMSQLQLPDEAVNNIILTSVVSAGHVFLQQPGQPSFNALNRLNNCMNNCYCQVDRVPPLPQPIEVGIVCAAPVMDSWYRAQLINFYPEENEADLRFMDYGGYARTDASCLRQIRSDFLSLPFQAVECYLANIVPLQGEADFSEDARLFIEQIAQNFTLLQTKTLAYSMDGIPLIEIFYEEAENGNVHSVNRELVERGLAAWYEGVDEAVVEYSEEAYLVPAS